MSEVAGNYRQVSSSTELECNAIILKLIKIKKLSGYRLCAQLRSDKLSEIGIRFPKWVDLVDSRLELRGTILQVAMSYAEGPERTSLISIDATNAFAHIDLKQTNIYFRTIDAVLYRLQQPVQGLGCAGTLAPAILFKYYKNLIRRIKRKLIKKLPGLFIQSASYSDNCLIITSRPEEVLTLLKEEMGIIFNEKQLNITNNDNNNKFRTLGLEWKIRNNRLKISRPNKIKAEQKSYYDYLLGNRPFIEIEANKQVRIFCDGAARSRIEDDITVKEGISAAGLYQNSRLIYGQTRIRRDIDQLISEAVSISMADEIRKETKKNHYPINTDSEICSTIMKNSRPRNTLEYRITRDIENTNWILGDANEIDELTKNDKLIDLYKRKRPRRIKELHSTYSSPTKATQQESESERNNYDSEDEADNQLSSEEKVNAHK